MVQRLADNVASRAANFFFKEIIKNFCKIVWPWVKTLTCLGLLRCEVSSDQDSRFRLAQVKRSRASISNNIIL